MDLTKFEMIMRRLGVMLYFPTMDQFINQFTSARERGLLLLLLLHGAIMATFFQVS